VDGLTDESWHRALIALRAALRPGGWMAFESRNPRAREWENWTREARRSVDDPIAGRVETWSEVHDVREGIVSYAIHYVFAATREELVAPSRLRFRSEEELTKSLADAGFTLERVYGDWDRRPAEPTRPELIVIAAVQNSFAGSDGDGLMALAAAAGASNASAPHVGAPACTGPGIAIAARSDGVFCIDVGGMVASG
jgi:hypothetical protein